MKINQKKISYKFLILILLMFSTVPCSLLAVNIIEYKVFNGLPYLSGKLNIEEVGNSLCFLIDIGNCSEMCSIDFYEIQLKDTGNGQETIYELVSGQKLKVDQLRTINCEDILKLKLSETKSPFPLAGLVGSGLFGDKVFYNLEDNEIVFGEDLVIPESFEMSFEYDIKDHHIYFYDRTTDGRELSIGIGSTVPYTFTPVEGISGNTSKYVFNKLGEINQNSYLKLSPNQKEDIWYDVLLGYKYLRKYSIYLNQNEKMIYFVKNLKVSASNPQASYFEALHDKNLNVLLDYILQNKDSSYATQAREAFFERLLNEPVSDMAVINQYIDHLLEVLGKEQAIDTIIKLTDKYNFSCQNLDTAIKILEAIRPEALGLEKLIWLSHEVDFRLGIMYMYTNELKKSHIHLLSALFGQPYNPRFNLALGNYMFKKGFLIRARSRYLKTELSNDYADLYLEQLETVSNDRCFADMFMTSDDRPRYTTKIPDINLDINISDIKVPEIVLLELYSSVKMKKLEHLARIIAYFRKNITEIPVFVSCQFQDMMDYGYDFNNLNKTLMLSEEFPVVAIINGNIVRFPTDQLKNPLYIINAILAESNKPQPVLLKGKVENNSDSMSIIVDIKDISKKIPVRYNISYFNGFSILDISNNREWLHRNFRVASETHEVNGGDDIIIDSLPDNYHVWQMKDEEATPLPDNIYKSYRNIFAGHSFAIIKIYDSEDKLIAVSKINLIDEKKGYYEYY